MSSYDPLFWPPRCHHVLIFDSTSTYYSEVQILQSFFNISNSLHLFFVLIKTSNSVKRQLVQQPAIPKPSYSVLLPLFNIFF